MSLGQSEGGGTQRLATREVGLLALLFGGSGCAALIYEIVWLPWLQLQMGMTSWSLGLLLATFMGGLGLGSLLWPKCLAGGRHPLRVVAGLEAAIGLMGGLILLGMPAVESFYGWCGRHGWAGWGVRALVASLCLLPPTLCMGATLPIMARWVTLRRRGVAHLGVLYAANLVGAVVGCLLAGFYLLRVYDLRLATVVAMLLNGAVGALAWSMARRDGRWVAPGLPLHPSPEFSPFSRRSSLGLWLAVALSGATALGAEVVWTRLLSLVFGATVYAFAMILAVFLGGLGAGSLLGSWWIRTGRSPWQGLLACQLLLLPGIAWSAQMLAGSLPYWPVNPFLAASPWFTFQLDFTRCLWAIWPATICWGASFPLALAAGRGVGGDPAVVVGRVYAVNTAGAITGALAFSLLLIPWIGTAGAERALILLAGASSLALLCWKAGAGAVHHPERAEARPPGWAGFRWVAGALVLVTAMGLAWALPSTPWGLVAFGRYLPTYQTRLAEQRVAEAEVPQEGGRPDIFCTYVGEGLNGSVAVTQWKSGERAFHSAGKIQASTDTPDMRLQRMLGHLPALVHGRPVSTLVVACGAGVTAGALVVHPEVERLVICDIEPLVPARVAPMFELENHGVLRDARTRVVADDGRHFLRVSREAFDVITSDPIDPWVKGCAALNTVEYYEMCRAHLNPGGVMALWIPLYECNLTTAKSMIGTFFKVFPHGLVWANNRDGEGYDAVLLGQAEPTKIDVAAWQARLKREDYRRVRESMKGVGFHSVVALLSTYAGGAEDLRDWLQDAPINTDRTLRLQYLAGMSFNTAMGPEIGAQIRQRRTFPEGLFVGEESGRTMMRFALEGAPGP